MNSVFKRLLVLSPHTDDGEFGCGGSISKFIRLGCEVFYVAFSSAEKSIPSGLPVDILKKEVKEATAVLGIPEKNLILFEFEVRCFPEFRQIILEEMIKLRNDIKPDIVMLPSLSDTHQDHKVIAEEGFRAFKTLKILGYEIPWNNIYFSTNLFVELNEECLNKKVNAIKCYKSQYFRKYSSEAFIRSLAITRGIQIGKDYAEAFEVLRWII